MDLFAEAREQMVAEQIARRGVSDPRVLAAMRAVPRHEFAGAGNKQAAYGDYALPIGSGQTISQPYMVARMTDALHLPGRARILEVGTGSGYQAAVLACLAGQVMSIERLPDLAAQAQSRLARLGYRSVHVLVGDGTLGWSAGAPYDGIIVTAGAPVVPAALRDQLADGASLVIPVGDEHLQHLTIVTRHGSEFHDAVSEPCAFVPLVGRDGWPEP
jgi:protein-L-isoaspartate(D-aspartate) O-methyltransferase